MINEQNIDSYFNGLKVSVKENEYMLSRGERYAMDSWSESKYHSANIFEIDELPWGSDLKERNAMADMVDTLRKAGVETFAITDRSTSLMEGLHAIFETGCTLVGPCTVSYGDDSWRDEKIGLEFKVNF